MTRALLRRYLIPGRLSRYFQVRVGLQEGLDTNSKRFGPPVSIYACYRGLVLKDSRGRDRQLNEKRVKYITPVSHNEPATAHITSKVTSHLTIAVQAVDLFAVVDGTGSNSAVITGRLNQSSAGKYL